MFRITDCPSLPWRLSKKSKKQKEQLSVTGKIMGTNLGVMPRNNVTGSKCSNLL